MARNKLMPSMDTAYKATAIMDVMAMRTHSLFAGLSRQMTPASMEWSHHPPNGGCRLVLPACPQGSG